MRILNFNYFITEKLGVAEASLTFIPILSKIIEKRFLYFLDGNNNMVEYIENVRFNTLKNAITDIDLYYKFPVVGFDIKYNFNKYNDFEYQKSFPKTSTVSPISIGGGAQGFGNRNWKKYSRMADPQLGAKEGIILFLEIEVHVNSDSFDDGDEIHMDLLHEGINSTLYHEMNHFYELYYLTKKKSPGKTIREKGYLNTSVTGSSDVIYGIPSQIVKYWQDNFLLYTYLCEDFELRSHVQEMDFYFKSHPQQSVQDSRVFKYYDSMSKFDAEKFYQEFLKVIKDNWIDDGDYVIDNLKDRWVSNYKKQSKLYKDNQPKIPLKTLENLNGYEFIKYWEKTFREKGEYVKRKIYKLASSYQDVSKK